MRLKGICGGLGMTIRRQVTIGLLASVAAMFTAASAQGQGVITGFPVNENVRGGALHQRAPGNMVRAGVARAQEFANAAAAGVEITETADETSVWSNALAESIATVFNQLNLAIVGFHNLLLARAGRPPVVPTTIVPATSGGGSSGGGRPGGALPDRGGLPDLGGLLDQFGDLLPTTSEPK
jgi:hypothetical protein